MRAWRSAYRNLRITGQAIALVMLVPFSQTVSADLAQQHRSGISASLESVGDQVDYSPNLPSGGFAPPQARDRYRTGKLSYFTRVGEKIRLDADLSQREMNSLRDSFQINQISLAASRESGSALDEKRFSLGASLTLNHADELYKNSFTEYNDQLITEVRLNGSSDATLEVSARLGMSMSTHWDLQFGVSSGVLQTRHSTLSGQASLDGCQYAFSTNRGGGQIDQIGRCGAVLSLSQRYPSAKLFENRFGLDTSRDIDYFAYFVEPHLVLSWQQRIYGFSLGVKLRGYRRPDIDTRISSSGNSPVERSHTVWLNSFYDLTNRLRFSLQATYHSAAFLDSVPLLYSAFTVDRFRGDGAAFYSIRLTRFL